MTPINISQEKMEILAQTFRCAIGTMPFTYLGLSMGTKKIKDGRSHAYDGQGGEASIKHRHLALLFRTATGL